MSSFAMSLKTLIGGLDPDRHAVAVRALRRCRGVADLEQLASDNSGWISESEPRLRLVKHGSGTFLILEYDNGWGTTLVQAPFQGRSYRY